MRIYEIFRKTKETYICIKINLDGSCLFNINIINFFLKHMLNHFVINSSFDLYILSSSDTYIDLHHFMEDIGIILGICIKYSVFNKNNINRYGFSYVPLDESLSRVVLDFSGRSYLKYDLFSNKIYLGNLEIDLFYDFFLSFSLNSGITLHIINLYGYNIHHKIESIFKSFGISLKNSLIFKIGLNSSKGYLF
ncbi:Imidazoleglycerol-phosphate dehydratase [Candidatus Nasuia deltocephalinicola]|nr:Imidazoleglycerol-phosphate dehydratase [Candidatus Nasuia deltocephalinicola]